MSWVAGVDVSGRLLKVPRAALTADRQCQLVNPTTRHLAVHALAEFDAPTGGLEIGRVRLPAWVWLPPQGAALITLPPPEK